MNVRKTVILDVSKEFPAPKQGAGDVPLETARAGKVTNNLTNYYNSDFTFHTFFTRHFNIL